MKSTSSVRMKLSIVSALIVITGFLIILFVLNISLSRFSDDMAKENLTRISDNYATIISDDFEVHSAYVIMVASAAGPLAGQGETREMLRQDFFEMFTNYDYVDGSAVMFEPNAFDGKDAEYIDTDYGTKFNGRLSYYFFKNNGARLTWQSGVEKVPEAEFEKEYYASPKALKRPILTDLYLYTVEGADYNMVTISAPVFGRTDAGKVDEENVIGVITSDIFMDNLYAKLEANPLYKSAYMLLSNSSGTIVYSPRGDDIGKNAQSLGLDYKTSKDGANFTPGKSILNGKDSLVATVPVYFPYVDNYYTFSYVVPLDELNHNVNNLMFLAAILLVGIMILLLLAIYGLVGKMLSPLNGIVKMAKLIAAGNFKTPGLRVKSKDEIGALYSSFESMKATVNGLIGDISLLAQKHSAGETGFTLDSGKYKGAYLAVIENTNGMAASYATKLEEITAAAESFSEGDFDVAISDYPGRMKRLSDAILTLKGNLYSVRGEINMLVEAGAEGRLSVRSQAGMLHGDWKDLISGLNSILDHVSLPLAEISEVMGAVAVGDFSVKVSGDYHGDFNAIKGTINTTVSSINAYIQEISEALGNIADGDLRGGIQNEYVGQFKGIRQSINNIVMEMNDIMSDIDNASNGVLDGAMCISDSTMSLAEGAAEQAKALTTLNALIKDIRDQVQLIEGSAENASKLSSTSTEHAMAGNSEMGNMLKAMDAIKHSSANISNIIKTIDDIASQTNLLALNAAVEAARAGVHGLGFGVVADEVRTLASRSQEALQNTNGMIEESVNRVSEGINLANITAGALGKIAGDAREVSALISSIAKSVHEQSEAFGKVTMSLGQISGVVEKNMAASEGSSSIAEELRAQAEALKGHVSYFKLRKDMGVLVRQAREA